MNTTKKAVKKTVLYNVCRDEKRLNRELDLLCTSRAGMRFIPSSMVSAPYGNVLACDKRTADKIAALIGDGCFVKKQDK